MPLSSRTSYALAVGLLLLGAFLRLWQLSALPLGLNDAEITTVRIAETIRVGETPIEVFFNINGEGQEKLPSIIYALSTSLVGNGVLGYRLLGVWLGILTLALVYTLGVRLYGPFAGLTAMGLLAVGMWPILLSRSIQRETFVPLLVTAALLALARAFPVYSRPRDDKTSTTTLAALGIILGIGFYIHQVGLVVTLAAMIFIAYMLIFHRALIGQRLSFVGFSILLMIIIAVPYLITSIRQPHLAGADRVLGIYESNLRAIGDGLAGLFFIGSADPLYNLPKRPLIDLVSGFFVIIGFVITLRGWRMPRHGLALIATAILAAPAFLATASPNFLTMATLLTPIALFFGLATSAFYDSLRQGARRIVAIGFLGLLAFNVWWLGRDFFGVWPQLPEVQQAYHHDQAQVALYLDRISGDTPSLICDPNFDQALRTIELTNTQLILQMMNRKTSALRFADCTSALVFADAGVETLVIIPDESTWAAMHPYIRNWLLGGEILYQDTLPNNTVIRLNVAQPLADNLGLFTTTTPISYPPEAPNGQAQTFPPVRFGGNITFLGYETRPIEIYRSGDTISVITYWRVEGVIPPDLTFFTHILSDPVTLLANRDRIFVDPRSLQPRDVFVQVTTLDIPDNAIPDEYIVSIGAYQDTSDIRLPVFDGEQPRGDRLFLYTIIIGD